MSCQDQSVDPCFTVITHSGRTFLNARHPISVHDVFVTTSRSRFFEPFQSIERFVVDASGLVEKDRLELLAAFQGNQRVT